MDDPAPIQATFVNFRLVPSRSVMQLVFEVPSERAQSAISAMGGAPSPGQSPQFGIVRLSLPPPEPKDPRMEPTPEQQGKYAVIAAGIRAREEPFQRWILAADFDEADPKANDLAAAHAIRQRLRINSRAEISTNPLKLRLWRELVAEYEKSTGARSVPA